MQLRKWLGGIFLFAAGAGLGPLALVAASPLRAPASDASLAHRLLQAYDGYSPEPPSLPAIDFESAVRDCGYTNDSVFGDAAPAPGAGRAWAPYSGYLDLLLWERGRFHRAIEARRIAAVEGLGAYEQTFLAGCIRQTLFAGLCADRVRLILAGQSLLSPTSLPEGAAPIDQIREKRTLCAYLDGLAARRGLPLAPRPD